MQQEQERGGQLASADSGDASRASAPPAPTAGESDASVRCFSEVTPSDGRLDFQIVDLGRQVYVWVSLGGARLSNLCFSIASAAAGPAGGGGAPATAVLLRGHAGASGEALAQRLALRLKRPVLCSCNIPADAAVLQVVAERRLLKELLGGGGGGEHGCADGGSGHSPAVADSGAPAVA